jgi:hypothetical protein
MMVSLNIHTNSIYDTTFLDNYINSYIDYDSDMIIDYYHKEMPSLFDGIDSTLRLSTTLFENKDMRDRFFEIFTDESKLYHYIHDIIKTKSCITSYLNIFPYIDEYVDDVFSIRV